MATPDAADALKEQGNAMFKNKQYEKAVELYSRALEFEETNAALFSNRSVCQLLLGKPQLALSDALQACKLKPDWEKGYYRQGAALEALGDLREALAAYKRGLELNPMSEELISKVRELRQTVTAADRARQQHTQPRVRLGQPTRVPEGGFGPGAPASWAQGLSPAQQAEWLTDCYRMRVDDDMVWNAGYLHGLYKFDATKDDIAEDFLIFCKLAVKHAVIPPVWDWTRFLKTAEGLLPYAYEKSDAKEKWGGENIFTGMLMGGRSLRFTAEVVYGKSCMYGGGQDHEGGKDYDEMREGVLG